MLLGRGILVQFSLAITLCTGCYRAPHEGVPAEDTDRRRMAESEGSSGEETAGSSLTPNTPDKERLQGTWKLVRTDSSEVTDASLVRGARLSIDCSLWRVRHGQVVASGLFDLDVRTTPKEITFYTFRDDVPVVTYLGIYRLGSDSLEICWVTRPTEFESSQRPSVVTTWTRASE